MPIDIYSMRLSPPCRAVLMTARQLDIDLNVKETDLAAGEHMAPEFLKVNPAHTVPTIVDDGFALWESRAIMQYLCNQYSPDNSLYPKEPKKRAVVDRWLNFDISLYASLRESQVMKVFTGVDPHEDKVNAFKNNVKLVDQLIGDNKYLTGNELTIADLSVLASLALIEFFKVDLSEYPNLCRWHSSLKSELPYYEEINHFEDEYIVGYMEKIKAFFQKMKSNQ